MSRCNIKSNIKSTYFKNVTIKGGVVMHSISNDKRRATRDIDLDFIKYSLDDSSIINFIKNLIIIKMVLLLR